MCQHYKRNCKLLAECCNKLFDCRQCHDAQEDHSIDRYATKTIECNQCKTAQPKSNQCIQCKIQFGNYYCNVCNLWTESPIYHCESCNICYSTDTDNRFHCDFCDLCFLTSIENHQCQQKKVTKDQECCVCLEPLYYQISPPYMLKCQHWIHFKCLEEMLKNGKHQCPLCKKSMVEMDWSGLKELIKLIPIAEMEKKEVQVLCNDCLEKTICDYHPVGHSCGKCESFNTVLI